MSLTIRVIRILVLLPAIACIVIPYPVGAQEAEPNFVTEPARGSSTSPEGGYFLIETQEGRSVTQSVAIRNDGNEELELRLDAVDARTGNLGGASYNLPGEPRTVLGAWITLSRSALTVGPKQSQLVPFTLVVPAGSTPGEHLGGISIAVVEQEPVPGATTGTGGGAGANIVVRTRRIIAVQVNTPGGTGPSVRIDGVEVVAKPDGLYLEILMTNDGHELVKPKGTIEVPSRNFRKDFEVDTFVPATSIRYPIKWEDSPPNGAYDARVSLTYEGEGTEFERSFTVGPAVKEELRDRQPESERDPDASQAGTGGEEGLPDWAAATGGAIFALLIAALAFIIWQARSRRATPPQ